MDCPLRAPRIAREIGVFTAGMLICRPTRREAEEYRHYVMVENVDRAGIDRMLEMKGQLDGPAEEVARQKSAIMNGKGALPLYGTPDDVAEILSRLSTAGVNGVGLSLVNEIDEFPYFRAEVLPRLERLGLRHQAP